VLSSLRAKARKGARNSRLFHCVCTQTNKFSSHEPLEVLKQACFINARDSSISFKFSASMEACAQSQSHEK
jgi:hypothetical protein